MLRLCACFGCLAFSILLNGQVKDTLRQKVDYRKQLSSSTFFVQSPTNDFSPELKKNNSSITFKSRDTIRDDINYKREYLMRSSFRLNPIHPFSYFFGIQLNQAYRFVFENNNWSSQINPYWLTFNVNHKFSGYGIGLGYGFFTLSKSRGVDSVNNETASEFTKSFLRLSLDKKRTIFKRFILDVNLDFLIHRYKDINKTFISGFVNENSIYTSGFGIGPRVSISYRIFRFLYVGTETGIYYLSLKETSKKQFTGLPAETKSRSKSEYLINPPFTLYLTFKIN